MEPMSKHNVGFLQLGFDLARDPKSWYGKTLGQLRRACEPMWNYFITTSRLPNNLIQIAGEGSV